MSVVQHTLIKSITKHASSGFTIVELLVVITVSGILIGILFGPLDSLYTDTTKRTKAIIQTTDTRGALRSIEHGVTLSYSFLNTTSGETVTDPPGTTWNWTGTNSTKRVLITKNYATTIDEVNDSANARRPLYSTASGCKTPLFNVYIYFVSNEVLYRRTLKNTTPNANICSGTIAQKQTCANGSCGATDAKILTGVKNFTINYYEEPGDANPLPAQYTDTTVPGKSKSVEISVTTETGSGTNLTSSTSKLRITRVNGV